MTITTGSRGRGYRHGDAKNALLSAAERLLDSGSLSDLSLRAIAEAAGVSRQAPYNHFRDKQALLAALARSGFDDLREAVSAARRASADPRRQLAHAAAAYIGFARERRSLFRLMFSRETVDIQTYPEALAASQAAYDALRQIVALGVDRDRVDRLSLSAWSIVHGYASLGNEHFHADDADAAAAMSDTFADLILPGVGDP